MDKGTDAVDVSFSTMYLFDLAKAYWKRVSFIECLNYEAS